MSKPLVSIICLCHNQERFVEETLESALGQSYTNMEVLVVDDGSTDGSKQHITTILQKHPDVPFIDLKENIGNTRAFNKGLALAKGKYVIDLACDDVMVQDRVTNQVAFFETCAKDVGVIYSDALTISESGEILSRHFENSKRTPYEGDVYKRVVETYFIPPPTMMMKKEVLDELGGYDGELAYEDFDFWVRSARTWKYAYQNEVLTHIRLVIGSHSDQLYHKGDKKLDSTIRICEKVFDLNSSAEEEEALAKRLKYEFRHAMITGNKESANQLMKMLNRIERPSIWHQCLWILNQLGLDLGSLRALWVTRSS